MKQSKKSFLLLLMISSIALLLVLQVFWLTSLYEKAYLDLRRDTNILFKTTLFAMRDSMLVRSVRRIPREEKDTAQIKALFLAMMDTMANNPINKKKINTKKPNDDKQIHIYISSTNSFDSVKNLLQPILRHSGFEGGGTFILSGQMDSLSIDNLCDYFSKSLSVAGIDANFDIEHSSFVPKRFKVKGTLNDVYTSSAESPEQQLHIPAFSDKLFTDWIHYDPANRYSIVLTGFRLMLFKGITPQLFFSLFLTVVTIAAFVMLYRNIRSQQRLMELKNDFISNMTHELKTPIATVSVALEALKNFNGMDNPKLKVEYLDIAQHELNRLTLLTDKVLKTSLFEDQGIDFVVEPVNIEATINQIISSMKLVFEKHRAMVSFKKEGNDFTVQGGSVHLTNVINNLLDNALKYSRENPIIHVSLKELDKKVIITVKDNGLGIAPEFKNKIFEKFFRVPTGDVHTIKGYGLGLSYVDTVIKNHNGMIKVESETGKGSTFIITLLK